MLRRIASRLRHAFGAARFRRELDEEMTFHLDALTDDLIREGMDPKEARRQGRIRFGNTARVHERAREERGLALIDETARNLRFAVRGMTRNPLFSFAFISTLALCLGLGATAFSVVDAVLWRALPYPSPERLAHAVAYDPGFGKRPENTAVDGRTWELVRDGGDPLLRAVYSAWARGVNLSTDDASAYVQQQRIGAGYFRTLGVEPLMGREFTVAEDVPGGPAVAMLSHGLWTRTFDADPEIVGRTIRLKGEAHTVVGITPADFRSQAEADVFTPLQPSSSGEGGGANYVILVRTPVGTTLGEAEARLGALQIPVSGPDAPARRLGLVPLDDVLTTGIRLPLIVLLAGAVLMLAVGVANLAGLQIARSFARRPELATRQALGSGSGALIRQVVVENSLLGVLGGLGGLAIAYLLVREVDGFVQTQLGLWQEIRLDGGTVMAAIAATAVATLLFAAAPILQVHSLRGGSTLTSGFRTVGGHGHALRKLLLVGQVAMVTTLLFGAGLLVRSYGYLDGLEPGFDPDGLLTLRLSLDDIRFEEATNVRELFNESLRGLRQTPGVASAAVSLTLPYERALNLPFRLPSEDANRVANAVYVTPGFFETLRIPLRQGRVFDEGDREDSRVVAVVNHAFADTYIGEAPALGALLEMSFGGGSSVEVVGVVGNVQQSAGWGGNGQPVWETPTIYLSANQASSGFFTGIHIWFAPSWIIRETRAGSDITPEVMRVFREVAPDLPVARVVPLAEVMGDAFSLQRFQAAFLIAIGVFALLLAGIGLYGIVAHEMLERRREMGLRIALGAKPAQAVWTAGSAGVRLALVGVAVGAVAAFGLGRVMQSLIFGVTAFDPLVIAVLLLTMTLLSVTASFVPAAQVMRLDPAEVLREA